MKNEFVRLNEFIELSSGGHILYVYEDLECYLNNAVSYIVSGIKLKHQLLVVDNQERSFLIKEKLKLSLSKDELSMVHYIDNYDFYRMSGNFHTQSIVNHFSQVLEHFSKKHISIRTWAHVDCEDQNNNYNNLKEFEDRADNLVNDGGLLSVCAYHANALTVPIQMNLMRNHEYFMTDNELVRSSLYENSKKSVIFPSLSDQTAMQTKMDLYKQKLDFVQVVSHEVRNPLTIIKAYCSIILDGESELSKETLVKIQDIKDYVDVIDNEMELIIQTEKMLTNEMFWKKEMIDPLPVVNEVIEFMSIKARTQQQKLQVKLDLKGSEKLVANRVGLKLVLSNLLSNAIKYSEEHSVTLFSVSVQDNQMVIQVKDHGLGMSNEQLKKLFKKYGKLNSDKNGEGIGLYMVKKLVDHFEGMIEVKSKLGEGTEATVKFPLSQSYIQDEDSTDEQ